MFSHQSSMIIDTNCTIPNQNSTTTKRKRQSESSFSTTTVTDEVVPEYSCLKRTLSSPTQKRQNMCTTMLHIPPTITTTTTTTTTPTPTQTKTKTSQPTSLRIGDIAKICVIIMCVMFLLCIVLHEFDHLHIFSPSYLQQGFCISNLGQSRTIQSHAISFYADAFTAMGMMGLVYFGRRRGMCVPSLSPISKNAVSLLGHGCGHLYLAVQTDDTNGAAKVFEGLSGVGQCIAFVAFTAVWYGFMRDSRRSVTTALAFALVHNVAQVFFLPSRFFFTHVLMAVLLNSAFRNLARPPHEKDVYYDMEASLVDVPILLASFGEAMTCDSMLINVGGHVWFDMVVPVMFTVYYIILVSFPHLATDQKQPQPPRIPTKIAVTITTTSTPPSTKASYIKLKNT